MSFIGAGTDSAPAFGHRPQANDEITFALSGGQSTVIDIDLAPGQGLVCALQSILHLDNSIKLRRWADLAGEVRLLINPSRDNAARLTIRTGCGGKVGVFNIEDYGGRLLCVRKAFLAVAPGVVVGSYSHYRNLRHGDLELIRLEGRGIAFLRSCGDSRHVKLLPGQHTVINSAALTVMSATVDIDPADIDPDAAATGFMRLTGPGQVWLQSGAWSADGA